ncbi:hypothetical protein [Methanococcus voltae]|jgi:hypothetical protein|uniref:Uncharacterized protein n=1 Tax=Methanococcus voltae (strain ATCC BAA-1334 / A3) TaxID=456320 RepID=D7DSL3_METV3|nr:hypothetical protein [Methanococcus voltae]MCS3901722.1 hypothetical protein [Methanococcus voltae]
MDKKTVKKLLNITSGKQVMGQKLTKELKKIDLPTEHVIDKIVLLVRCKLKATANKTVKIEEIGKIFSQFNVLSDNAISHYAVGMNDILKINHYMNRGKNLSVNGTVSLDDTFTIGTTETTFETLLLLDCGDILAFKKQALELNVDYDLGAIDGVTVSDIEITVTLDKDKFETMNDYYFKYGTGLDVYVEPKVTVFTSNLSENTNLDDTQAFPIGNILDKLICTFVDTTGARSDGINSEIAVRDTVNSIEYYKQDYLTMKYLDAVEHDIKPLLGVVIIDMESEITNQSLGFKEYLYTKDQFQIATHNKTNGKLRVIRIEHMATPKAKQVLESEKLTAEATND